MNKADCRKNGLKSEVREFNTHLDKIQSKVFHIYYKLLDRGEEISIENVRNYLTGKAKVRPKMILAIFREHNSKINQLIGKGFSKSTVTKYQTCYDHTVNFIRDKYGKKDLEIQKINYEFITEYEFWLKSKKSCAHNNVMKYLTNFKKIVLICVKNGWLATDPFSNYRMSRHNVNREALTELELERFAGKIHENESLNRVRDVFLFCCFTGLCYTDVYQLKSTHLIYGINREMWLVFNRGKTGAQCRIPLLPLPLKILKNYLQQPECQTSDRLLPVLSNQKTNLYLKQIAALCKIDKHLTFHLARHTFATTVTLTNGVPIESVSKMLGHTSMKTTQIYAKIVNKKISEDMNLPKAKLSTYVISGDLQSTFVEER